MPYLTDPWRLLALVLWCLFMLLLKLWIAPAIGQNWIGVILWVSGCILIGYWIEYRERQRDVE